MFKGQRRIQNPTKHLKWSISFLDVWQCSEHAYEGLTISRDSNVCTVNNCYLEPQETGERVRDNEYSRKYKNPEPWFLIDLKME